MQTTHSPTQHHAVRQNRLTLRRNRSGITLLFVVSMIVLFLLMGTTFVVISNDYLKSARRRGHHGLQRDRGAPLLERAFYDLVRGPSLFNTTSPLRGQSLLADLYGYGYKAEVDDARVIDDGTGNDSTGGQFFEIKLRAPNGGTRDEGLSIRDGSQKPFSPPNEMIPDAYNGLLLTFTSQEAAGLTTRIVDYYFDVNDNDRPVFRIAPVWSDDDALDSNRLANYLNGAEVIINGAPFAGTGAGGFVVGAGRTEAALTDKALRPNRRGDSYDVLTNSNIGSEGYLSNDNAPNEPWDAADYQNMFLAYGDGGTIPSFYRRYPEGDMGAFREFTSPDRGVLVDNDGDGTRDGIWMDIGLPVQTDSTGRYIKPLVSYKVIDLDGRLNLNAAGNLADADPSGMNYVSTADTFLNATTTDFPRGQGYGPAEISLKGVLNNEYAAVLRDRYGFDDVPGAIGRDDRSRKKLFGYPADAINPGMNQYGTRGRLFASNAMDIFGRFAIGTPQSASSSISDYQDPNNVDFPNGLPSIDMLGSSLPWATEIENSPYEMNFAMAPFGDANDSPFTPQEFERLLRTQDRDAFMLPQRLWDIANMAFQPGSDPATAALNRAAVTTESWSIPALTESQAGIVYKLAREIAEELRGPGATPNNNELAEAHSMLPPEFLVGLKMNVNREFGNGLDDDGNGVVDEPGEINTDFSGNDMNGFTTEDKQNFAQQLFVITLLFSEYDPETLMDLDLDGDNSNDPQFADVVAQWCANVVDFRDPDSIMTAIEFDRNPFNGWDVNGNIADVETDINGEEASLVIRGCERPELLLTEVLAFHDRRTEDEPAGGGTVSANSDDDFDSRLRPNASAFIELYNPWTQNLLNQELPRELYGTQSGVDLTLDADAINGDGGSPVWRIAVRRFSEPGQPKENMLRAVYFGDNWSDVVETDAVSNVEVFSSSQFVNSIRPGMHAVIGTGDPNMIVNDGYITPIGRLDSVLRADEGDVDSLRLRDTRHISLVPDSNLVRRLEWDAATMDMESSEKEAVAIVIDSPRAFNISDPFSGYPDASDPGLATFIGDGYGYLSVNDDPLDHETAPPDPNQSGDDVEAIWTNGITPSFRIVDLQRLADPTQAWNANYNPYVTIDSLTVDLMAYNGVQLDPLNNNIVDDKGTPNLPVMGQGHPIIAGPGIANTDFKTFERGFVASDTRLANLKRLLWYNADTGRRDSPTADANLATGDQHRLSFMLVESLGETNDWYTDSSVFTQPLAYPWLQWNNRPYVSHLELANVPISSPDKLTQQFTIDTGTDPYASILCPFGHMPNMTNTDMNLYRVLDLLEVPSRFVGAEQYLNGDTSNGGGIDFDIAPFNYLSGYRVPGKINLNSISSPKVWEGLMREYGKSPSDGGIDGAVLFGPFHRSLDVNTPMTPPNVFKPSFANRYVPRFPSDPNPDKWVVPEVETGLFRPASTDPTKPLFDFDPGGEMAYNNSDRSPYFRNQMRQRLGNLVTNQSNVYAIWITVGYFNYDPSPGGGYANGHESEVGFDLGEVKRSRAFFIFDRSIPMGFEPGRNHNVDRGILVKSIIDE